MALSPEAARQLSVGDAAATGGEKNAIALRIAASPGHLRREAEG
jgi:hypothetical protein